jgi:hypothetical protein
MDWIHRFNLQNPNQYSTDVKGKGNQKSMDESALISINPPTEHHRRHPTKTSPYRQVPISLGGKSELSLNNTIIIDG